VINDGNRAFHHKGPIFTSANRDVHR
jgi:hypothetical protein